MDRISRRRAVRGAAAAAAAMTLGAPSVHAQKDQQTLRFVAQADLKILDPVVQVFKSDRQKGWSLRDAGAGGMT